ncbi:GNAT family N-acetyltransferase [Hahella ganghwensis]|uniref:GNAT family N-acetyltransferase n=1 Tax=Hahella ganghwensis TaxID=286420 RepID=UPI00035DEAFB|nr:GNAT family N-acetyltransferase [Hahella ganghwensis]
MTEKNVISIKELKPGEDVMWDDYVRSHPCASPYHFSAWGKSVQQAYGHTGCYLVAWQGGQQDPDGPKIVGVMPAVKMSIPLKGNTLCSLPFCDIGMGLGDSDQVEAQLISHLQDSLAGYRVKSMEVRFSTNTPMEVLTAEGGDDSPTEAGKVSMILDLPETAEELWKGFKSKLRSQIRKAEKNGLTHELGNRPDLVTEFYEVFARNMRDLGSPVHSQAWFEALSENYGNDMVISIVRKDGVPVGGGIVLYCGGKASIPWASTVAEYNRLAPNMMLYWSLLEETCRRGCTRFDFGRSTYGEGTYKFKSQWGARPYALVWREFDHAGQKPQEADKENSVSRIRPLIEAFWRKLPLSISVILGPKLRRYISL